MIQTVDPTQLLSLNCVISDDPDRMFTVEIEKTKNVSILKDMIKEKKAPHLNHIAASDLDLWQVECPIGNLPFKNRPADQPELRSEKLLSEVFPAGLDINCIHVVAFALAKGEYYMDSGLILLIIPSLRFSGYRRRGERSDQRLE